MIKRLRKIRLPLDEYRAMPSDFDRMSEILARRAGVADLRVDGVRPDGDFAVVFVHSETFAPQSCYCGAHDLPLVR